MQSALKSVKGVSEAVVTKGKAVVTVDEEVKVAKLIKALKKAGYGASEKKMKKG